MKAHARYGLLGALVLGLLLGLLLAAGPAGAVTKTFFTTTMRPVDDPLWSHGDEWITNLGMTCHVRDRVMVLKWVSSDPRLTGKDVITAEVVEVHWVPGEQALLVQEQGTATLYVKGDGVWECTWTGDADSATMVHVVRVVGFGVSGSVAGLHFTCIVVDDPMGITGSGYIIEP